MPVPSGLVVKNAWKIRSAPSTGNPTPESLTETVKCPSSFRSDLIVSAPLVPFIASMPMAFVSIAFVALTCAACRSGYPVSARNTSDTGGPRAVKTAQVSDMPMERAVTVAGTLAAQDQATVSAKVPGRVETITVDLGSVVQVERTHLHSKRRRHDLDGAKLGGPARIGGISKDCRSGHVWRDPLEQLQPFTTQAVFEQQEAGGVAARSGKALYEAAADRIDDIHKHDRHGTGRLLQRRQGRAASS